MCGAVARSVRAGDDAGAGAEVRTSTVRLSMKRAKPATCVKFETGWRALPQF